MNLYHFKWLLLVALNDAINNALSNQQQFIKAYFNQ